MTTIAPTTIGYSTIAPSTAPPDYTFGEGPIEFDIQLPQHALSIFPSGGVEPTLDLTYDMVDDPIEFVVSLHPDGESLNKYIDAGDPVDIVVSMDPDGKPIFGYVFSTDASIDVIISLYIPEQSKMVLGDKKYNFVKWSKIGQLDFEIDESNVAGERPLDWQGSVYEILKLVDRVVAYGQNGVTFLKPSDVHWGMETIYRKGPVGRDAVAGIDDKHWMIDSEYDLCEITDKGVEKLGYSEFLSNLTNPVLSIDSRDSLLYMCDGTYGYVYNFMHKSFGEGPVEITDIGYQNKTAYVVAPVTDVAPPAFNICTDIYDFGTRKAKTIYSLEVGTELTGVLQAKVEYRHSKASAFVSTPWTTFTPDGIAYLPCYGREFRFWIKTTSYEFFELDYVKINGVVHEYTYLDTLSASKR